VDDRWPLGRAAERFGVSVTTAQRWSGRYREQGQAGMCDRSSRPNWCPRQLPTRTDPATGCRLQVKPKAFRYEHKAPGDLVHVDIKKLGRIPDGGGHRFLGRAAGVRVKKGAKPGTAYIHHAMDDHSRLVYSEILNDERKETASGFWTRANDYFNGCGITVVRVLTETDRHTGQSFSRKPLAPSSTNEPAPTSARPNASPSTPRLSTPTIITAATPHSAENHQPTAFLTSVVSTPRNPSWST
jgi:hypothetical protein